MISCFKCYNPLEGSIFDLSTLKYVTNTTEDYNCRPRITYSFLCDEHEKYLNSARGRYLKSRFDNNIGLRNYDYSEKSCVSENYHVTCDGCRHRFALEKDVRAYKTRTFNGKEYHFCSALCGIKAETRITYKKKQLIYVHKDFNDGDPQFFANFYNCVECDELIRPFSAASNFCKIESIKHKDTFILIPACKKCMPVVKLCPDVEE